MSEKGLVTFQVCSKQYAIDLLTVKEFSSHIQITQVSNVPDYVKGLASLRGQVLTVLDLGCRLGIGKATLTDESCLLVLKTGSEIDRIIDQFGDEIPFRPASKVALLIDAVEDIIQYKDSDVKPVPANMPEQEASFVLGAIDKQNQAFAVIDLKQVLRIEKKNISVF